MVSLDVDLDVGEVKLMPGHIASFSPAWRQRKPGENLQHWLFPD